MSFRIRWSSDRGHIPPVIAEFVMSDRPLPVNFNPREGFGEFSFKSRESAESLIGNIKARALEDDDRVWSVEEKEDA